MNANYEPMNHQSDSEAAPPDVFPDFAVSLDEAGRRVRMLSEFVRDHMTEGEDYGTIPGTSGKPTLFKPGAEKMNAIFGLAPIVEITNRNEDWDKGFVAYEVKVTLLNKRTSNVEAEGVGNCNSRERKYKNQDAANVANTILKMAKKRALIDATLSATRASGLFTQDLEDLDLDSGGGSRSSSNNHAPQQAREYSPRPAAPQSQNAPSGNAFGGTSQQASQNGGGFSGGAPASSGAALTDAQRSAILAIASKVFGRSVKEEMAKMTDKPISQLSKSEASAIIDKLRAMLPEQPAPREGEAEYARNGSAAR